MARVTSRDLREDTSGVLRRAANGELIEVTVNGEAVARLGPLGSQRSRWTSKADFVARLSRIRADAGLHDLLCDLDQDVEDVGPIG